ncbi:low-density lipoprotein receptor-related protein 6-like isoform X2 [Mytilus californianus]|uniref:low-density lipoprotein receptor-related protein 6-like isoform X2 n=1 Tax=Mytilus californianus TaxID=6549 RepID=UPI0022478EC9|nr:low-density lipoprotein receptor-related protein 6-like isoform X2 [Mytilus californianus]
MAVNYKKGLRTYENEKFDRNETVVGDEDDDQQYYEEIAEYVDNASEEKKNQNKYTGWNERGKSKSRNSHNKKKFGNNRNENTKDIELQLPIKQRLERVGVVNRTWRTACVVSGFVCIGLMSVIGVLVWLLLSTKVSQCDHELERSLPNGNHSVSTDKPISNCHTGFYGERCEAEETTKLLYTIQTSIRLLDENSSIKIEIANTSNALDIDYHETKGFVYWTELESAKISRTRYPPTSSERIVEVIVSDSKGIPDSIAVDSDNDHIYWTDRGLDRIMRSNLDGSNKILILDTGLKMPRAIELDTTDRWIYFSDWGSTPKIEKCMFDGSSRQTIITTDVKWPNGIALDFFQKRLYWCDAGLNQIKSAKFDGSDVQVILKSSLLVPKPFNIDIDDDNIYFTDFDNQAIFKLSKSSLTLETVQKGNGHPLGLKVYRDKIHQHQLQNKKQH